MSLLSDPNLLIHSLRLNYLRNVEDPYGPRLISFDPSFSSNAYIGAAAFADVDRWPELAMPVSPPLSEDEAEDSTGPRTVSGFPGATGLKHSQTILGPSRTGALGMGVSGRRRASVRRPSALQQNNGATQSSSMPDASRDVGKLSGPKVAAASPLEDAMQEEARVVPGGVIKQPFQFVPKFKGAAEMDERRRLRLQARHGASRGASRTIASPNKSLMPELSSEDEDEEDSSPADDDEDEFDDVGDVDDSMEIDVDEFDPEFATASMGVTSDSVSDNLSVLSASMSAMSTSNSSNNPSSLPVLNNTRSRARLSPVNEGRHAEEAAANGRHVEPGFEMVTPPPVKSPNATPQKSTGKIRRPSQTTAVSNTSNAEPEDLFARQKVVVNRPVRSALTSMLASSNSSNPFSDLYSAISGRGVPAAASTSVSVYFPMARAPAGRPMTLNVRKDATIEEVLGFALWSYWEEGWEPRLDEGGDVSEERLSAVGWVLRIAEDDGEVDEDFPPPDRTGKIAKFNFDAYAVLEATPTQIQQNTILESKIQRSPSRVAKTRRLETSATNLTVPSSGSGLSASAILPSTLGNSIFSSSLGPSSGYGPQMFLRIRVQDTADAVHISTTIPVSATMYMQEALELVCRKRKLQPKEYALLLGDMSILIPLDRTVASLQGKSDLMLAKRSMLPTLGVDVGRPAARSTDPNASIFKRMSETPEAQFSAARDYTAAYKKYTVYRKMPMLVGRHERVLAIDGPYVHIMPSSNKAKVVFDNGKTSSYHINSVVSCQQSGKSSSSFRFVVHRVSRDGGNKRYEFEAENAKTANEIVQTIKGLKSALERTGTVNKLRRSKQII
ncbi:SIN1-domain-containing protein [Artomyces pyxidatus]|uniref:SIN1-domain-containing protein n=1 Tax=Artomyces pyxidatus TaxID=48021 RepID=A0ACB8TBC4_9AGAM|nr:SIN1-domain-containing protein [Artomyces pyxidatus]